jgi:hypothetical protein
MWTMSIRVPSLLVLALAGLLVAACGGPSGPDAPLVRVDGRVMRGPTAPTCQLDVPCEAPFSAGFSVRKGARTLAQFRSNANGEFTVELAPGAYVVVPDADAPLLAPQQQERSLSVPDVGAISVELSFDTGIR